MTADMQLVMASMSLRDARLRLNGMATTSRTDLYVGVYEKAAMFVALEYMRASITRIPQPVDSWTTRGEAYQ